MRCCSEDWAVWATGWETALSPPLCPTRSLWEQLWALGEWVEPLLCSGLCSTSMFYQGRGRLSWGGPGGCSSHLLVKAMLVKQLPSWAGFWPESFSYITQREWEWGLSPFSHFSLLIAICWQRSFPPVGPHRVFLGSGVYGGHLELMDIWHSTTEAPLLLVSISSYGRGRWRKNTMKR